MLKKIMMYAPTSYNRSVYASPPVGGSGYEKPQSAYGLCAVFLRHIFAVAGTLRVPLSQPQKRHIQPGRYVKYGLKCSEYNGNILIMYLTKNQIFAILKR
jgi:hypothetical protein